MINSSFFFVKFFSTFSALKSYFYKIVEYKIKYIRLNIDEWELYDLEKDPNEMNNVYDDPEYTEVQEMMHARLEELRTYYGDSDENNQKFLDAYLEVVEK